MFDFII